MDAHGEEPRAAHDRRQRAPRPTTDREPLRPPKHRQRERHVHGEERGDTAREPQDLPLMPVARVDLVGDEERGGEAVEGGDHGAA